MKRRGRAAALLLALMLSLAAALPAAAEGMVSRADLQDSTLDLSPYEGKALFLNFFTEWCPYCMLEMPDIKKIFDEYSKDELQIILVHVWSGEDERNTQSVRQKYGMEEMTFFEDKDQSLMELVGLYGFPTSVFINKDGSPVGTVPYALEYEDMASVMEFMGVSKAGETSGE